MDGFTGRGAVLGIRRRERSAVRCPYLAALENQNLAWDGLRLTPSPFR